MVKTDTLLYGDISVVTKSDKLFIDIINITRFEERRYCIKYVQTFDNLCHSNFLSIMKDCKFI